MECLDENVVLEFVDGTLDDPQRARAEAHLSDCEACSDWVAAAAGGRVQREPAGAGSAPTALPIGTSVGRYVILGLVGRGGMGEVYAAYDPQLDRRVALKLLHETQETDPRAGIGRERLLREAKAIARLHHPNVVVVHDAGAIGDSPHGERVFVAMEFVEGATLADWLVERTRSWQEIRDVFVAAGEGLAAAHEAGLVHRDFKPHNMMVGRDGSVRVMDFGLATDAAEMSGGWSGDTPRLNAVEMSRTGSLTRSSVLLGTPLYMSPEQMRGQKTDARTDQFSFCVALYEALYREHPFPADSFGARFEAATEGRVREPKDKANTPSFLWRLVVRGLAVERAGRYPSMRALLEELRHNPARRRRRVAAVLVVAALATAAVAGGHRLATQRQQVCLGAPEKLADIWELSGQGERRGAIHRAFQATGKAFADETWTRVAALLDDYARRWAGVYRDNCEATHARGDQSPEVMDLRMTCLEGPRAALKALTDVLARADGAVLVEAVNAVHALPHLDRCSSIAELRAAVPLPADPARRARIAAAQTRLAEVKASGDAGQVRPALDKSKLLMAEARAIGYEPLLAESLAVHSWLLCETGHPEQSTSILEEAIWTAIASHRDDIALDSVAVLISVDGYFLAQKAAAERWQPLGEALLRRIGPGHERSAAWLYQGLATVSERAGDYRQALADLDRALALKQSVLPTNHPDVAETLSTMANVRNEMGDHLGALAAADKAVDIYVKAYGESNPILARPLGNRGETLELLGWHADAERDLRRAVDLAAAWVGPDNPWGAYSMTALGKTLLAEGRAREAAVVLERALRVREQGELNRDLVAETQFALAKARWATGRDLSGARALAESAVAGYRAVPGHATDAAAVQSWLAARPPGRATP